MSSKDQVLLVTGASRGIGATTCRLAAAAGYRIAINYRTEPERAAALCNDIIADGGRAVTVGGDVSKLPDVERIFDEAANALGPVTAVVNNAGAVGRAGPFADADPAMLQNVIDVNLVGLMLCTREAIRRMALSRGGPGGVIVNVSSCAATLGSSGEFVWYAASKAGVDSFTMGVAREVADDGIRINAVAPGMIDTEIHERAGSPERVARLTPGVPMRRIASPDEVAKPILFLLSSDASYMTGSVIRVGGGR
jgi:NAD(P)-dependent dehydrogenase (short-subunit alcohol dehydrogenase family)